MTGEQDRGHAERGQSPPRPERHPPVHAGDLLLLCGKLVLLPIESGLHLRSEPALGTTLWRQPASVNVNCLSFSRVEKPTSPSPAPPVPARGR